MWIISREVILDDIEANKVISNIADRHLNKNLPTSLISVMISVLFTQDLNS